jgi:AcrR family transcriptional regulator
MAADTYHNILDTAHRLFIRQGYTATSMRQVAEQAGIGKATIYHHFPNKQAIILALLEQNLSDMDEARALVRAETDPRRRIQVAAEASIRSLFQSSDFFQIIRREVPGGREQLQTKFLTFFSEYLALLSEAVQTGIERGIFRPVDPMQTARVFMTMIQGSFAMAYLTGDRTTSSQQAAANLLDIFFQGIELR